MLAEGIETERRWLSFAGLVRRLPLMFRRERPEGRGMTGTDILQRAATVRYHLGRGRRAREAGRFDAGCSEARRAIDANPGNPWSYALLGQCLSRQRQPDLIEARRAFERACALEPANGYFVRLLLDVLDAQGDAKAREDALFWAWWSGAPVERWLPDGPRSRHSEDLAIPAGVRPAAPTETRSMRPSRVPEQAVV
jgi:tetratricopeptide (TPR) repeat protein